MKIMVVGGGGREHAIIKSLKKNSEITEIYALPGNGGIAADAHCVDIGAKDIDRIVKFAKENAIDFAVVAPDDPLVLGAVDKLSEIGIPCFGPKKNAAIIEGSKVFSKNLMKKYGIPTAKYEVFGNADDALRYLETAPIPTVIKADGLALGKGVIIAQTRDEAKNAVRSMMQDKIFGESGSNIVIEEFLEGPEVSVLSFTDGKTVVPMISSMDHKRAHDGDEGLNTGGMGTIAPNPYYTKEIADECMKKIFLPTIDAMNKEGRTFSGCLYFGLMLTKDGPKVIEYNCRFGDPETQVVLPLLESDLFTVMRAVADGKLAETEVKFSDGACCCVVMASDGYPGKYETGFEITLPEKYEDYEDVFVAGAKLSPESGKLLTSGGRVLGASACADNLETAVSRAYALTKKISFGNAYCRSDIGAKAISKLVYNNMHFEVTNNLEFYNLLYLMCGKEELINILNILNVRIYFFNKSKDTESHISLLKQLKPNNPDFEIHERNGREYPFINGGNFPEKDMFTKKGLDYLKSFNDKCLEIKKIAEDIKINGLQSIC